MAVTSEGFIAMGFKATGFNATEASPPASEAAAARR
jgi:hypothetical protein